MQSPSDLALTLRTYWIREWIKPRGARRGRYRRTLKYYWEEQGLFHSGPFTTQAEAEQYLATLTKGQKHE